MRGLASAFLVGLFVVTTSGPANATEQFGEWIAQARAGNGEVYTANDSGSVLGLYCVAPDKCFWYLDNQLKCKEGSEYPALVAGNDGASHISLTCRAFEQSDGKRYVAIVTPSSAMEEATDDGERVGIAVPAKDGTFRVSRFSLDGIKKARATMMRDLKASAARVRDSSL